MAEETDLLQRVLFPRSGAPGGLYLKDGGKRGQGGPLQGIGPAPETLSVGGGERIATEAYFNCFYPAYWAAVGDPGRIGVRVEFRGRLRLTMRHRESAERPDRELVGADLEDGSGSASGDSVLWLDEEGAGRPTSGRLFVEVEALGPCEIASIAFVTDTPPLREVSLSIGICTYNREADLTETLKELIAAADRLDAIKCIHVVNQGNRFASEALVALFEDPRLVLAEQANLGGCGGFNRTMFEAVRRTPRCSHHLMMDDDVLLDGRILENAVALLAHARHDIVLGGAMLYVSRPSTLHEAGSAFDPLWFIDRLGDGIDLADAAALDWYNAVRRPDYIGWWFCAMRTDQIEAAGFSPPIFLHHDDIEYGCRMGKRGVPTVVPPGLGVWHEHAFSRDGEWEQYYDIRNRLILSVMHGDLTAQPRTPIVLGYVVDLVLTHRYRAAMMCIAGIWEPK